MINPKSLRFAHEGALSLSLGFAAAYAFTTYISSTTGTALGGRISSDIADFLHIGKSDAELIFLSTMTGVTLTCFVLLSLLRLAPASVAHVVLDPFACIISLASAPAFWLCAILFVRPGLVWVYGYPTWPGQSGFSFLVLEVSVISVLLYVARRYAMALWFSAVLLSIHYVIWGWYMWPDITIRLLVMRGLRWVALACPASALTWLLYARQSRQFTRATGEHSWGEQ